MKLRSSLLGSRAMSGNFRKYSERGAVEISAILVKSKDTYR
jgi:hypothetical protein